MAKEILRYCYINVTKTGWYNLTFNYAVPAFVNTAHTVLMRVYRCTSSEGRKLVYDRRVSCPAGGGTLASGDVFLLESIPAYLFQGSNVNYKINIEFDDIEDYGPAGAPGPSDARTITITSNPAPVLKNDVIAVFAPHQDDDTLLFAQTMTEAVKNNKVAKVVFATNAYHPTVAYRLQEAVNVLTANNLNIPRRDIIFMGYGDGTTLERAYTSSDPNRIYESLDNMTRTFGDYPKGLFDFNFLYRNGRQSSALPYSRNSIRQDFEDIVKLYKPSEIYTTSVQDSHTDHKTTYNFLNEVLSDLKISDKTYSPKLNCSIVWGATSEYPGNTSNTFLNPFAFNGNQNISTKPLVWQNRVTKILGTGSVTRTDKASALLAYKSQISPGSFLSLFAKNDEYYWTKDFADIAYISKITRSSENASTGQFAVNAANGVISGFGDTRLSNDISYKQEWAVSGGSAGWIKLDFGGMFTVRQINLYDRVNATDNIMSGRLSFSDGAVVNVGALPPGRAKHTVTLSPARNISWVRFDILSSTGPNTGLAEIEVIT